MPSPRVRLAVAAALFVGWLGWLGYLAATGTDTVVLSRPQFLVSNLYVVADLEGGPDHPGDVVTVREASGPAAGEKGVARHAKLTVKNLPLVGRDQGWDGPGEYILALTRNRDGTCLVTATPPSPGYPPAGEGRVPGGRLRIYPATDRTLRQLRAIVP
jgi:hypothetical protein